MSKRKFAMDEYCCEKMEKHVEFFIIYDDAAVYLKSHWHSTPNTQIKYCPFCGKEFTSE